MCVRVGYSNLVSGMSLRPSAWKVVIFFWKGTFELPHGQKRKWQGQSQTPELSQSNERASSWPSMTRAPGPVVTVHSFQSCIWEGIYLDLHLDLGDVGWCCRVFIASDHRATLFVPPNLRIS